MGGNLVHDFLLELIPVEETAHAAFPDWDIHVEEADRDDDIREYPELWDKMNTPEILRTISPDDYAGIFVIDEGLNLNAMAVGLGLEDIEYSPEDFPGLIYNLRDPEVTVLCFSDGTILSINKSQEKTIEGVTKTLKRLTELGMKGEEQSSNELTQEEIRSIRAMKVSDFVE